MVGAIGWFGGFFSMVPLTFQTGLVFTVLLLLAVPCQKTILRIMGIYSLSLIHV